MPWSKMDANFDQHPQGLEAGWYGRELYLLLLRISKRFDLEGKLPARYVSEPYLRATWGCPADYPVARAWSDCLNSGLISRSDNGDDFLIDGWERWNPAPSTQRVQAHRARMAVTVTPAVTETHETPRIEESRIEESRVYIPTLSAKADEPDLVSEFVATWNREAHPDFARVLRISAPRRKKALAALKEAGPENVGKAISNLNAWPWRGKNGEWKPSFDYLCQDSNLLKFAEGAKGGEPVRQFDPNGKGAVYQLGVATDRGPVGRTIL